MTNNEDAKKKWELNKQQIYLHHFVEHNKLENLKAETPTDFLLKEKMIRESGERLRSFSAKQWPDDLNFDDVEAQSQPNQLITEAARRLKRLRTLGGSATYLRGKWAFKLSEKLINLEQKEGRERSSAKTIRADLVSAATAEKEAAREGRVANFFPT